MAPKKVSPATSAPVAETAAPAPKTSKKVVAEPVAPAPVAEPVVADVSDLESEEENSLVEIGAKLASLQQLLKETTLLVKAHQKIYIKLVRQSKKIEKKKAQAKKSPSGFAKPSLLADELCKFLGVPVGTKMARTQVTKHITDYVKEKGLLDPANKRNMNLDATLKKLMVVPEGSQVTFFNLQKFIKHLFIKETPAVSA